MEQVNCKCARSRSPWWPAPWETFDAHIFERISYVLVNRPFFTVVHLSPYILHSIGISSLHISPSPCAAIHTVPPTEAQSLCSSLKKTLHILNHHHQDHSPHHRTRSPHLRLQHPRYPHTRSFSETQRQARTTHERSSELTMQRHMMYCGHADIWTCASSE